jgi:hypothetical protein
MIQTGTDLTPGDDEGEPRGRRCIFCGAPADSREHIFPDWINNIFNPQAIGPIDCEVVQYSPDGTSVRTHPAGQVAGLRHRIVCSECNGSEHGGWMSDLDPYSAPI